MTLGTHAAFASILYLGGATLFGYRLDWFQLKNCNQSLPDQPCSLSLDALLTSPPFTDITEAHVTYAGGGSWNCP